MGGSSSKDSLEVERNRRLREFEEELVLESHNHPDSDSLKTHYFRQHDFSRGSENIGERDKLRQQQQQGASDSISISGLGVSDEEGGKDKDIDDKEVEDAIAELEETFRTLSPPVPLEEQDLDEGKDFVRSKSCGPSSLVIETPSQSQSHQVERRQGTPAQNHNPRHLRNQRRPGQGGGGSNLSRSSGGLIVGAGPINVRSKNVNSGGESSNSNNLGSGAFSAPPYVSDNLTFPNHTWTPPQIHGFDVSKFREANRRGDENELMMMRLPPSTGQTQSSLSSSSSRSSTTMSGGRGENPEQEKKIPPSYTRAELDLLKNLEREVW